MKQSYAVVVWLAGFILFILALPKIKIEDGFLWGFFVGILWTGIIISLTKKSNGNEEKSNN